MTKTVFVVAHSHWDHEWYFTQEDSDIILVENLDYLIDTLENDPAFTCYSFDGQFSIVEKYLKIRPENKERLLALVEKKRLFIGPWYTQADALLGMTESVIRNLLYGVKYAESFGHSMNIGYAPDIFGQHAYLPSIYSRFGMDYSIFQRGVYNEQVAKNLNFLWEAPNKETIKTNNIFYGYGPGKFLTTEENYVNQRLLPILDELARKNQDTNAILLPAGGDQVIINQAFPETVKQLNELDSAYEFLLSDYETFMAAAWDENNFPDTISGELLACQKSRIHNTCRSERYDIKRLNFEVEELLIHELEPLCLIGQQHGIKFPQNWLDQIWKKIFDSQAHNGIGASNSDDANHDIVVRLTSALRQVKDLINLVKRQLVGAISSQLGTEDVVTLFNTDIKTQTFTRELVLFSSKPSFGIRTVTGEAIEYVVKEQISLDGGKKIIVTSKGEKEEEVPPYYRSTILLKDVSVPAMGYTTLLMENQSGVTIGTTEKSATTSIENESFKFNFADRLVIENLQTGERIEDPFHFDDTADAGDSFDYSPLKSGDEAIIISDYERGTVTKNDLCQSVELTHTVKLPAKLTGEKRSTEKVEFVIQTKVSLYTGENFIRITHQMNNQVLDHRVRVNWKTGVTDLAKHHADQGYSALERLSTNPYQENWRELGFVEKPMPIYPLESFVALSDEKAHFTFHTGMMKEYQVEPEKERLSVTLFRSNGLLGRDGLAWRPGRASGINNMVVETPDGQMLTEMSFDYFVSFGEGRFDPTEAYEISKKLFTTQDFYQVQSLNSYLNRVDRFNIPPLTNVVPSEDSLLKLENKQLFMSTAKKEWAGDGMIIRLFNPNETDEAIKLMNLDRFDSVKVVDLAENVLNDFVQGQTLGAKDFLTLCLK